MKAFKKLIWNLLNFLRCGWIVQLALNSGLKDSGWMRSFRTKRSVDAKGDPIPWLTYAFIHFIEPRLNKQFSIAEFGSGGSSAWWAQRVGRLYSIEHNSDWAAMVQSDLKNKNCQNATIAITSEADYHKGLDKSNIRFDLILIDGIKRNECMQESVKHLSPYGVIVLDNSNVVDAYADGMEFLKRSGFKRIDFYSNTPIVAFFSTTTLFYREENCLGV